MPKRTYLEILRAYLAPEDLASLLELTETQGSLPFEYDRVTERIEPAMDAFDPETADTDSLAVVLTACDILSDHISELDLQSIHHTTPAVQKDTTLAFLFESDDPQLEVFYSLLRSLAKDNDYDIHMERGTGTVEMTISFTYLGEQDYQRKKDQVYLLRDIASRRVKGQPFQGNRL